MAKIGLTHHVFEGLWDMNLEGPPMRHPRNGTLKLGPTENRMDLLGKGHAIDVRSCFVVLLGRNLAEVSIRC